MKIGIIGGGQLGMMMAEEAVKLGHQIISLDPNPDCSITKFSSTHIARDYNDKSALKKIDMLCDVITYEFENVDLKALGKYTKKIPQKLDALKLSRDRIIEKNYARSLGIKTPSFTEVNSVEDIFAPSILKTTTGGYDGKGQYKIPETSDIDHEIDFQSNKYICEELIDFDFEISVVATRDSNGGIAFFPIPINKHVNGILHTSVVENMLDDTLVKTAKLYTKLILDDLDYVGTLAVEYFVVNNEVIFNEFAPRPHNSGHYTMDGCNVSQFYNHILAITGEHIVYPRLLSNTVMINVLGQNQMYYENAKNMNNVFIHDYLKDSDKQNRKIGHINYIYKENVELTSFINQITKEIKDGE